MKRGEELLPRWPGWCRGCFGGGGGGRYVTTENSCGGSAQSGAYEASRHRRTSTRSRMGAERGVEARGSRKEGGRERERERKPRAPGRQNDQKANFIHYFHFNATVSQFMGGPGFMRARIRTTGPNLRGPTGQKHSRAVRDERSRARPSGSTRAPARS